MEKMAGITVSDGVANVTDAHVKFLKQVNSTKLENLKYANSLMANMHKITKDLKGNFDRLADTLNEDIIEQLKEVAKLLDEINNKGVKPEIGVKQQAAPALSLTGNQTEKVPGTDPVKALQEALSRMKWKLSVPSGTGTIAVTLSSI
jgi:predicted lipase